MHRGPAAAGQQAVQQPRVGVVATAAVIVAASAKRPGDLLLVLLLLLLRVLVLVLVLLGLPLLLVLPPCVLLHAARLLGLLGLARFVGCNVVRQLDGSTRAG